MRVLHHLMEKPWETPRRADFATAGGPGAITPAATVGLRVFMCVVTVLFSLLVVVYGERMRFEDWRPGPRQLLLWFNTALLIVSSVAFYWASFSVRRRHRDDAKAALIAAGFFAVSFLVGQLWAWRELSMMIGFDIRNPAVAFFYLITALHGLHLLGGLVAWGRTTVQLWHGDPARCELAVRLCAIYWHFLLVLWLILFGLLFSGSDNLGFLLAICGLR